MVALNRATLATTLFRVHKFAHRFIHKKKMISCRDVTAAVAWQLVTSAFKIKSKRNAKWCMYASWPDRTLDPLTYRQIIDVAKSLPHRKWVADRQDCDDAARRLYCAVREKYPTGAFAYATMESVPHLSGPHAINIAIIRYEDELKVVAAEPQRVGKHAEGRLMRWPRDGYVVRELHF